MERSKHMNWYLGVLKDKYTAFEGRAGRREFWRFVLYQSVILVLLSLVDYAIGTFSLDLRIGLLGGFYGMVVMLPSIAMAVRRLHDTGRSGWWLLAGLVPLAGEAVLFLFYLLKGQAGENRYGADPLAGAA
jgi:uncharacterized membrane protein YhaH (DUF805 family)